MQNTPFWWEAAPLPAVPMPPLAAVDVAIVGGGYTGIATAIELAAAGKSVAVFEKARLGEGASSRNGGMTSGSIRLSHAELTRRFGEARALAILHEGQTAREDLWRYLEAAQIACDFQLTGLFDGALTQGEQDALDRKAELLHRHLGVEARSIAPGSVASCIGTDFYRSGMVRPDIGGLDPAKLFRGMVDHALALGAALHETTAVLAIERQAKGFLLTLERGTVTAGQVIQCTNGHTDGADPWLRRRLVPVRSRIIATEPLPPEVMARLMPGRMMYGDMRQLSYYFRPSPDGRRILFGGRDGTTYGDPMEPTLHLRRELARIFPELADVGLTHSWFGNVAMNRHMIPKLMRHDGRIYATGYCGSGVVWARWLGKKAARAALGDAEGARSAFDFQAPPAVPLYRGKPWFIPAVFAWYAWADRRTQAKAGK
jgi:glycine/D-amino acid oxidase-like deaminating enzyme